MGNRFRHLPMRWRRRPPARRGASSPASERRRPAGRAANPAWPAQDLSRGCRRGWARRRSRRRSGTHARRAPAVATVGRRAGGAGETSGNRRPRRPSARRPRPERTSAGRRAATRAPASRASSPGQHPLQPLPGRVAPLQGQGHPQQTGAIPGVPPGVAPGHALPGPVAPGQQLVRPLQGQGHAWPASPAASPGPSRAASGARSSATNRSHSWCPAGRSRTCAAGTAVAGSADPPRACARGGSAAA